MELIGGIVLISYTAVVFWLGSGSGREKILEALAQQEAAESSRRPLGFDFGNLDERSACNARSGDEKSS